MSAWNEVPRAYKPSGRTTHRAVALIVWTGLLAFTLLMMCLAYLVILLETVGFLLVGFGLVAEMVAQLRDEVDALRRQR